MRSTQILYPLNEKTPPAIAKSSKELWKKIKIELDDLKKVKMSCLINF